METLSGKKAKGPPSFWWFVLHGNNTRSLLDECFELAACCLVSSKSFEYLMQNTQNAVVGFLLFELHALQNYFGLIKVLISLVIFVLVRGLRFHVTIRRSHPRG